MGFRLRYTFSIDYIPAGIGVFGNSAVVDANIANPGGGPMTTVGFRSAGGGQNSSTFNAADVTALTNAAAADMAAQLNAQLARIQQFPSGGT